MPRAFAPARMFAAFTVAARTGFSVGPLPLNRTVLRAMAVVGRGSDTKDEVIATSRMEMRTERTRSG